MPARGRPADQLQLARGTDGGSPTDAGPVAASSGLGASTSQDQVLRNQAVGSTWSVSASGPALVTWTDIKTSWGSALA